MMHLLIGKLPLLGYRDGSLVCRNPAAEAVTRRTAPLLALRDHRDAFHGEDEPSVSVTWPWPAVTATVTDVFGEIELPVSVTPVSPGNPRGRRGQDSTRRRKLRRPMARNTTANPMTTG
jgi:hypothetical protein